MSQRNI